MTTPISARQAAQICYDLYAYEPSQTKWLFQSAPGAECYYGVTEVDGTIVACFRGSTTLRDFLNDLHSDAVMPAPSEDFITTNLGPVHPGAWAGLEAALLTITDEYSPEVQFIGHSLGAMRATLATATIAVTFAGTTVLPRIVFGECASGYAQSADAADMPGSLSIVSHYGMLYDPLYGYPFRPHYTHGTKPFVLNIKPDDSAPREFVWPLSLHYMGYYKNALVPHQ